MARVTRRRIVEATPARVWELVCDPYNLPRWWPRTSRVESVDGKPGARRTQWTQVLETAEGRGIRADYRCVSAAQGERYVWEQQLAGTPFAKHLSSSRLEIELSPELGGTGITLTSSQTLRGLSRLGSPMMRGGQGRILEEALEGIERALGGGEG